MSKFFGQVQGLIRIYRFPILAIAGYVAVAILWHRSDYWQALWTVAKDPVSWAENTYSVIVFTVLVSWVVSIAARHRKELEREPYEGWSVEVRDGDRIDTSELFWEEVRLFKESRLEERRFIQSVISSQDERLKVKRLDICSSADWIERNEVDRKYVIDMVCFRAGDDCKV